MKIAFILDEKDIEHLAARIITRYKLVTEYFKKESIKEQMTKDGNLAYAIKDEIKQFFDL